MASLKWTTNDIPDQTGKRALVTGANSGIGFYTALELARHGATVVLASRDPRKAAEAAARILKEVPGAKLEKSSLDLASLASVRAFATTQTDIPLDLLINNAGVMAPPKRKETLDGMELQFGTNVVGHFALTALLLPSLTPAARVVTLASIAHKSGKLDFNDLQSTARYNPMRAYQQSKLADLMFAFELQRRLKLAGSAIESIAAHPGVANTNLFHSPEHGTLISAARRFMGVLFDNFLNSQPSGALPTLYAATAPEAKPGGYYGPQGFQEMRGGDVGPAKVAPQARDEAAAAHLWKVCEELCGLQML
ncbi:NAD(P)-dependent dehydrogenase, short-chain alcohol dehydrogenase family [Granulicella pectinivorans]|jgi:NAD(P)-dependent dehydrogenase (short-subunit alcohol dehydrogenase family)|uniref:NAD(P)-dependent dehydrogenase, short-chain alcohol dehydrogenase family n=1 Tax=Granulicella pectinivorans TaxID=474950 RepID=A0A1I6LP95_9BACT|nr:oxidoreductase [Granulicella pectinivorans]SFS05261.1 NAD(P)-dependent dehydrogenase, short-chain alcohol dehydrogenase family [Granulicella pectinivorans]